MSKFYGPVGFIETKETTPGVWEEVVTEEFFYGDILRKNVKNVSSGNVNDDVDISNEISILASPYAMENFHLMKYVGYMGAKWKITSIDIQYPRLNLSIGGVYNA